MKLVFIWHMHQPYYKDLKTGEILMPWVRLHGVKDYLDMLLILDEFPHLRQTFNLVPSLLDQIVDYTANRAEDSHLRLSRKNADNLDDDDKLEILDTFFSAHEPTMIRPYPRYLELLQRARRSSPRQRLNSFSAQDFRDLQFWSNAVWIDPMFRSDARVKPLYAKGRNFDEAAKQTLLDYQIELMTRIIPEHQKRVAAGKIEVSFTPYYHPILPLLVDHEIARAALPQIELPKRRFAHPEDADEQIRRSVALYRSYFGDDRPGMWPSEGSVSESILPLLQKHGIRWIATDEEIYQGSVRLASERGLKLDVAGNGFHRAFSVGDPAQPIGIFFRDHKLSDKIGFVYSGWDADKAADDLVTNLRELDKLYAAGGEEPVVSIILDGENAWEYYPNDGHDFLRALYSRLEQEKTITTVTPRDLLTGEQPVHHLPNLFPGSWINHNFRVWIGHAEDNAAWDLLTLTRDKLAEIENSPQSPAPEVREFCWQEIYIAEGSDWCWWYGDEHHTDHFRTFDALFRKHLQNVWEALGLEPPPALLRPIRKLPRLPGIFEPTDFLHPSIDGRQTSFFEWFGAGRIDCNKLGGAMHRADNRIYQVLYGYDDRYVYFRIDFEKDRPANGDGVAVQIEIACLLKAVITIGKTETRMRMLDGSEIAGTMPQARWQQIVEVALPRELLKFDDDKHLYFAVAYLESEKIVERWPEANYIAMELPDPGQSQFWQV